jgi:hypothetical protein
MRTTTLAFSLITNKKDKGRKQIKGQIATDILRHFPTTPFYSCLPLQVHRLKHQIEPCLGVRCAIFSPSFTKQKKSNTTDRHTLQIQTSPSKNGAIPEIRVEYVFCEKKV